MTHLSAAHLKETVVMDVKTVGTDPETTSPDEMADTLNMAMHHSQTASV